jgi:mRNA interferase MazF
MVTPKTWIPDAGDIVWLDFDPPIGHEQAGRRPAIVLSPIEYNGTRGLLVCCPLTTAIRGYPFEVLIDGEIPSVALADQVTTVDWEARYAKYRGKANQHELADIRAKVAAIIGL